MVFFTAGAQLIDAIIIRTAMFTLEQAFNIVKWSGSSVYTYYYPTINECDRLKLENEKLKEEIKLLNEIESKVIILDN